MKATTDAPSPALEELLAATDPGAPPEARLAWATHWLKVAQPGDSASPTVTRGQSSVMVGLVAALVAGTALATRPTLVLVMTVVTCLYAGHVALILTLVVAAGGGGGSIEVSDEEARAVPDGALPRYSVLVPAYREPEVMADLLRALDRIEYPRHRLEIILILEGDDDATIAAAFAASESMPGVRAAIVAPAEPRTKPKALNYGLLEATGDLVAVYDCEDVPEPLQLRRAAVALAADPDLGCVQARLNYFNSAHNLITRWFTLEYAMWFDRFLPGLMRLGAPIPLGGTSNHFRRRLLLDMGGWDPFNVTEDADLGLRLHRRGHRVAVLSSTTLEEANSDFVNWVKQRSRWYKGYLQTWLLNLRRPGQTVRKVGWRGFFTLNLFVGGTPMLAVMNPIFWGLTASWFLVRPAFIQDIFPAPLLYLALATWVVGNLLLVYSFIVMAAARPGIPLVGAALTLPVYFVMMSLAAYKALFQLVVDTSYWEKTTHGLTRHQERRR